MPITHYDQISLLKDILNNHQIDCCGSISECEQLERLIKSLLMNPNINDTVKTVLLEVYNYSQNGQNTNNLDHHIQSNQENLTQWVTQMNSFF
ncbi:hypothetical protein J6TS2_45380 [Heyndrickxia sporothermodurans]|nr:hypothetical protein J6TS2_45380 [Heyndrickxia sporothermodurans]